MKKRKWSRNASICGHRIKLFQRGKGCWWGDKVSNNELFEKRRRRERRRRLKCILVFIFLRGQ